MNKNNVIKVGKAVVRIVASISVARIVNNAIRLASPTSNTKLDTIVINVGGALIAAAVTDAVVDHAMKTVDDILKPLETPEPKQETKPIEA